MKKLGFLLVVLSLTMVGLAGCKKESSTTTTPAPADKTDTNDSGAPAPDASN